MNKEDYVFHNALYKEEKPVNYHKLATLITFIVFIIGGGLFFIMENPGVTGYVAGEVEKSNSCLLNTNTQGAPLVKDPLTCNYLGYKENNVLIDIQNNFFPIEKNIKITHIKINNCDASFDKIIGSTKSIEFEIPCQEIKLANELSLKYQDMDSGLSHSVNGKLNIIKK